MPWAASAGWNPGDSATPPLSPGDCQANSKEGARQVKCCSAPIRHDSTQVKPPICYGATTGAPDCRRDAGPWLYAQHEMKLPSARCRCSRPELKRQAGCLRAGQETRKAGGPPPTVPWLTSHPGQPHTVQVPVQDSRYRLQHARIRRPQQPPIIQRSSSRAAVSQGAGAAPLVMRVALLGRGSGADGAPAPDEKGCQ